MTGIESHAPTILHDKDCSLANVAELLSNECSISAFGYGGVQTYCEGCTTHMCAMVRFSLRRSYVNTVQSAPAECTKFGEATSTSTVVTPFWCSENRNKSSLCECATQEASEGV